MKQLSLLQPSLRGNTGRRLALQTSLTHIQYQHEGDATWQNLIDFNLLAPDAIRKSGGVFLGNIQFKSTVSQYYNLAIADNIVAINLSFGSYFWLDLTENVSSFSIINAPPNVTTFTLVVKQNSQSIKTLNFNFNDATLKWVDNAPPSSVVSGLNHIDVFSFSSHDEGDTWFAGVLGQDFKSASI
jgi:hypothetical protein